MVPNSPTPRCWRTKTGNYLVESIEELLVAGYGFQQPGRHAYFLLDPEGKLLRTFHPMLGVDCENCYVFSYGVSGWRFMEYVWKESSVTERREERILERDLDPSELPVDPDRLNDLITQKIVEAEESRMSSGRMAQRVIDRVTFRRRA
jgi:hypothetical protein